ncbi:4-hydroxy-tetrahydrodipicolinate synthase [Brumimicrobium salinarum]|uniref:4-hydroxy-tetrahydrodipicolinate synthase n=1 Tax=Brumimicrobium salinarum TaxID=2058658 RepID=A0A2I0R0I9_9FLAO|nr:4-hydroxy-tetrahydrodipicolinate synthase [Brumimicrobium salinarum]PKR80093.1 4-hydroxy-tetrahydrodipicolinate synthase [Brumimicrobium salinarum]
MEIKGTGVALVTPFKKDGSVDVDNLRKLVKYHIINNVDFLVVQGTTGETATLNNQEKEQVLNTVVEEVNGEIPIVLGLADNNTAALVESISGFNHKGIDAFLSASPHYNKPSQRGIVAHFKAIAEVAQKPIILYNVPGRTGSNMSVTTILELAQINNIIGVKEASGDINQVMELLKSVPENFVVLSGEDALTMPIVAMGGHGVISVVANAFPAEFSTMIRSVNNGDLSLARKHHFDLLAITESLFKEGNPSGIKYCLQLLGLGEETVRLPLTTISDELKAKMQQEFNGIDLISKK